MYQPTYYKQVSDSGLVCVQAGATGLPSSQAKRISSVEFDLTKTIAELSNTVPDARTIPTGYGDTVLSKYTAGLAANVTVKENVL